MMLQIERPYIEAMVASFPRLAPLREHPRFGDRVEVAFRQLSDAELDYLQNLYREAGPEMHTRSAQIATLQRALGDGSAKFTEGDRESVVPAVPRFLITDAIRGWVCSGL